MDKWLVYTVTGLGCLLRLFSFVVIFRGKRLPGDAGGAQQLELLGMKTSTNMIVTLLIISAVVAVMPLWLQTNLEAKRIEAQAATKGEAASSPASSAAPGSPTGYQVFFNGEVLDERGKPAVGAEVALVNMNDTPSGGAPKPLHTVKTDSSGAFDLPPVNLTAADRYLLVATGVGHNREPLKVRPLTVGPGNGIYVRLFMMKTGEEAEQ